VARAVARQDENILSPCEASGAARPLLQPPSHAESGYLLVETDGGVESLSTVEARPLPGWSHIGEQSMEGTAGAKLSPFHQSLVKRASKSESLEAAEQFSEGSADEEVELEAASGLEPESRGFAERKDDPEQPAPNPVKLGDPGF